MQGQEAASEEGERRDPRRIAGSAEGREQAQTQHGQRERQQHEELICSGKPMGELRTDRMYQNFILELEWRHMVPKGNAGIFVWADDITAQGVPFHRSIEVQVLENAYGNTESHTTVWLR